MNSKSAMPNRPYAHYTDLNLAKTLVSSENLLDSAYAATNEVEMNEEERQGICLIRNQLIEEILFRYQHPLP